MEVPLNSDIEIKWNSPLVMHRSEEHTSELHHNRESRMPSSA